MESARPMKPNERKYLEEHHSIAEAAIGKAKLRLKYGDQKGAIKALNECCSDLEEITKKYQPATAKAMGLIK